MATPPLWNEIESNPTFQELAPEQKSKVLSGWSQQVIEQAKTPEEKLAVEAISDAKHKFFAGAPMPENMGEYVKTYAQQKAQQEADAQAKEKADRPFFGFGDTLNALGTIASNLPTNVKAAAYQLKEGLAMPSERSQGYREAMAEKKAADEAVQADQAQREAQGLATTVGSAGREFSNSSGFSGVAMGAAALGGAAGEAAGLPIGAAIGGAATAPAGGVGAAPGAAAGATIGAAAGIIGGLASSGAAAYRMAGASFLDDAFALANEKSVQEKGRPLDKEEEKALHAQLLPIAKNTALWEAGPEAIGNVFTMGVGKFLFKDIGKEVATTLAKRALTKAGLVAADVGVELAGETATQVGGQGWDQAKMEAILAGKNPDEVANPYAGVAGIAKGFEEIAPATLFGSALMGGGAGLVGLAKERYIKAQKAKAEEIAATAAALADANAPQVQNALVQTAEEAANTAGLITPTRTISGLEAPTRQTPEEAAVTAGLAAPTRTIAGLEAPVRPTPEEAAVTAGLVAPTRTIQGLEAPIRQTPEEAAASAGLVAPTRTIAGLEAPIRQTPEEAAIAAGLVSPIRPIPSEEKAPPTPTETQANAPTQERKVESPSGTPPIQGQPPVEVPAVQAEEGTPPRQGEGEVTPTGAVVEPTATAPVKETPAVEGAAPLTGKITVEADKSKTYPVGTSREQKVKIGETQVFTIKHETDPKNSKFKIYAIYNQAGEFVKSLPYLNKAQKEAKKMAKELTEVKPKSYRKTSRFPDNPNTQQADILNFVADSDMVVPSAKFKAAEAKAGKSVGGERDPLRDVELDEGEKRKLWTVSDTMPFDSNTIDVVAQLAFEEKLISEPNADALIEAMVRASKERKAGSIQEREQEVMDEREKQTLAFDKFVSDKKNPQKVVSSMVRVGDRYVILEKEFTVTDIEYDEEGNPIGATLTNPTFGEQKVGLEEPFYVTEILGQKKKQTELPLGDDFNLVSEKAPETPAKVEAKTPAETTPDMFAEKPAPATESEQPTEAPQLTERQKARLARKEVTQDKLDDLARRRQAAADKFRKSMGRTSMAGLDSEQFGAALELAVISAETGAVKFLDFAQDVRDQFPELWDNVKDYLSGVWNQLALNNEELEEAPLPREARKLIAQMEATEVAPADPIGYGKALIALFPSLKAQGLDIISMEETKERLETEWQKKVASGKANRLDQLVYEVNLKNVNSALEGGGIGGVWTRTDKTVAVGTKATPSAIAHEVGHAIMELEYTNADTKTKEAIQAAYAEWFQKKYGVEGVPTVADQRRIWEWMEDADWLDPNAPSDQRNPTWERYRSEFKEWFADEVAKWATVREQPRSLVDKFFVELSTKLKKLWDKVSGSFQPDVTLAEWLDSLMEQPTEVAPATKSEQPTKVAPATEEVTPTVEEEPVTEPINGKLSITTLKEKIGFGKQRRKTVAEAFMLKPEYLLKTIFEPAALANADAETTEQINKLRDLISQTEEYKSFQKEQSMSESEVASERKKFEEKMPGALQNIKAAGFTATTLSDGSIAIAATKEALTERGKAALVSNGFSYDNQKGWVSKTYARVVELAHNISDEAYGTAVGNEAVVASKINKIRKEQRKKLADQKDQSAPPAGKTARPYMTAKVFEFFKNALNRALGQEAVKGGKVSIPSQALEEQQWDSMLISKAQADGKPMYLLASSAGTGKTFVMGAALANIRSRNPEGRIVFVTRSQELIAQVKEDFANFPEVQNIEFMTYSNLDDSTKFVPSDSDVLIFDEAHEVRYGLSDTSSRSKKAAEWMSKAKFTLLTTATPYESIEQMEYLKATGVFDSLKDVRGLFDDGWYNFAAIAGAKVLQRDGKPSSLDFDKMTPADKKAGQLYAREFLRKNGMFSQRSARIPDGMSEATFQGVKGSAEWSVLADEIKTAFDKVEKPSSNDKGFYTNILKRILEASKANAAIDLARKEAAEGRQVVIFVETKSESDRNLVEIVEKWDAAQAEYLAAKAVNRDAQFVVPEGVPNLPGVIEMFRNLIEQGVGSINFESAQDKFKKAFGDQVVFYTGDEAGKVGQDSLSRWENPDSPNPAPIMVATMARGGTGLSLHDTSEGGKYPRTQIMLNLPWRASEVEQVAGRTVRYGMTSVARSFWLFANNLFNEASLATRVGERLNSMNMLVRGEVTIAADKIGNQEWVANLSTGEVVEIDKMEDTPIEGGLAEQLGDNIRLSLSSQSPAGKIVGGITAQNAKNGLALISKLIPMAGRMVRLATSTELLADESLTTAERASVRSGAQGYYSNGKVVVITDQVKQTIFHKNADIAAASTILHELMHHGTSVIRNSTDKLLHASWLSMISEYVTDAQLDRLVKVSGYRAYANWRTDMSVKEQAMEEIFVRQIEGLFVRKGSLSFAEKTKFQKFLRWLKSFINSALGLPESELIPDAHLEDMGRIFIKAINASKFTERAQGSDVRESAPDLGSLPDAPTNILSPYSDEEKASLVKFKEDNPQLGLNFSQILGLEGSIAEVQSIAASETLAYEYLRLNADKGRPVVGKDDVDHLLGVAAQLTARGSTFGATYREGKPEAATGVLQMVLTQAGLEMARNGDSRLIEMLRQNWNGIVMGAFLTHSSAGRLLQSRSAYKNEILDTMYELEQAAKAAAVQHLQEEGVEDAEKTLRSIEELLQKAELDAKALRDIEKAVSGIKVGAQDTFSERIAAALENTSGEIKRAFAALTQDILRRGALAKMVQDMRDKKAASSASQNWLDDMGMGEPLPDFGSLQEAEAALAKADRDLVKRMDELGKALKKKPKEPTIEVTWDTPTPPEEEDVEDLEDVEDVGEEENKNEATKAAEAILANLKAFLEKKYSKERKAPTIYAIIKKAVDENIANTPKYSVFKYFADALDKELEPFGIEDSVKEELISTAWSTSSRYAEKEAEKITDRFLNKPEVQSVLKTEETVKLRALVKEFLRNKKKLDEQAFVDEMTPLAEALKIPAEIAEELAMATYNEHLVRKNKALERMLERTKASLLAGSRKTLVSQIKTANQADINDAAWQDAALRKVLTLSGILPSELNRAMAEFSDSEKALIFGTTVAKMDKTAAENINKTHQRLIKNYEEYLKQPTNAAKPTPSETLRKLVRNLVAIDISRPLFVTQAAAFGATEAQANRLYDLAMTERSLRKGEETSTTKMGVLIKYITSDASLQNDPKLRIEAIKSWLKRNGYTSQAADNAASAIDAAFDEHVIAAQMAAMEKFEIKISSRKQAELKKKAENANVNVAEKQVKKLQDLIRLGLGKDRLDPTKSFAKAAGYENLQPSDYKAFGELDLKITQAKADQRIHDYAIGVKELYELLARRKLEMGFLARLAISYNNSALSGLGTLAINIIAPMGALITRVGIDMGAAISRGDVQAVKDIFKVLQDTASIIKNEVKFSITGGANTNDWSRVIMNATSLQQPLVKALEKINNPKTSAFDKLKARMIVVQSYTDVTRRVLMATDHVWFSMMENYFRKSQALDLMRKAGVQDQSKVRATIFSGTNVYGPRLAYELGVLHRYENAIEGFRGLPDAKAKILDLITAPLDANLTVEARQFEEDIRGDIRRASQGGMLSQATAVKQALGAARLQRTLSNIRIRDNVARDIQASIKEILPDAKFLEFVGNEAAYEMGVHRGEEAPNLDVINNIVQAIQGAGNNVIKKHPIVGRMLLGYFGIPSNLLNRAMWFTPYGLIRYAIAAKARKDLKVGPNPFYQQSMATNEQIRQRLVEAIVGTTAIAILMSLKALSDDEDDDLFNVTLTGPTNKTELDAWKKAGHRQGSIEMRVGDKIVALNVMRGPLEPLKIALLMVGAMDDMRLNRKENDGEFAQYFSEYLSAALSGWSKQASFFGAKSTLGATLAVDPDSKVLGTALYKLNPIIPFSGLISSVEKLMTGGDRFRGREGSLYLNLPIARSLLTERAVNALGDPQGLNPSSAWTEGNERAWYAGFPLMVSGTPTGNDKKVYGFILDRGIAPGLPQRTALENKNGVMSDSNWQDYVAVRGQFIKKAMIRDLARLEKMDDDSAAKALGNIGTEATAYAKKQLRYK